ncbi:hypothetical protein EmuJ_000329500 [Echinococcus multilocularis]|uniref:Uncharacterized protein n=1 Tax=Echinococcus multilocularis TaxID=6211 RepID=A0A068XVI8_ECHMU|nr:hypothetical protein EmuJ_000329500 [Echinococcus multilocularis]
MERRRKVDSWLHYQLHFSPTPRRSTSRQRLTLRIAHATADCWIKLEELPEHLLRVAPASSAVSMKQCQLQALADRCQLSNDGCRESLNAVEAEYIFVVMLRLYAGVGDIHTESILTSEPEKGKRLCYCRMVLEAQFGHKHVHHVCSVQTIEVMSVRFLLPSHILRTLSLVRSKEKKNIF